MTGLLKLVRIYNAILIPIAIILFILLYISIKASNLYAMYSIIILIILSPFIAYFITKRLTRYIG